MNERVENLADFLYRRARGLDLDAPLPPKDDFIWRAFRRQAKDLILFGDAQRRSEAADNTKDRIKRAIVSCGLIADNSLDNYGEADRLRGKVEGLKLALSYIEEEERLADNE